MGMVSSFLKFLNASRQRLVEVTHFLLKAPMCCAFRLACAKPVVSVLSAQSVGPL